MWQWAIVLSTFLSDQPQYKKQAKAGENIAQSNRAQKNKVEGQILLVTYKFQLRYKQNDADVYFIHMWLPYN